jgi:branched-chain amino acid transport system permease protein
VRILFKTSYLDDIRLFQHGGHVLWYGLLGLLVLTAPWLLPIFYVGELTQIFILAIAGVGLMLLIGYTGLVSLGHGAFMAVGAYTNTYLVTKGVPFLIAFPAAGLAALIAGIIIAVPANRMSGIYLAIATLAFSQIVEQVIVRWEHVTRGFQGMAVPPPDVLGQPLTQGWQLYYLCLAVLVLVVLGAVNLVRSPTGRALVAIRDSEISAQSLGVNLFRYKTAIFALSACITGLAGALLAHRMRFISPDAFNFLMSIQLLLMVVVGGLGSIHGAVLGAIFVGALPQAIAIMREYVPTAIGGMSEYLPTAIAPMAVKLEQVATAIARTPGLEPAVFGLVMVAIVLFEPLGLYGRWFKIKAFFDYFPLYRRATFKRQRAYLKTERVR